MAENCGTPARNRMMLEDESMALPYRADWPERMAGSG
jgi:hypothetical protein